MSREQELTSLVWKLFHLHLSPIKDLYRREVESVTGQKDNCTLTQYPYYQKEK
jgi:hypothetical protein